MSVEETPVVQLASGALAGMFAETCTHPIDTIRARLQHQRGHGEYTGLIQSFRRIVQIEGVRGLFGGLPPVLLFTIPAHALYFFGYESSKKFLQPDLPDDKKSPWVHFVSGLVAELAGAALWTPQDVLKQRLQILPPGQRQTTIRVIQDIVKTDGISGMFKGFTASLMTYGPFVGIYFVAYEKLKSISKTITNSKSEDELPLIYFLIAGGGAGALSAAVTCPLDVVKTRIQIESKNTEEYSSIRNAFRTMVRNEGYGAFWKGLTARITWIAPACALTLAAYEQFKLLFVK